MTHIEKNTDQFRQRKLGDCIRKVAFPCALLCAAFLSLNLFGCGSNTDNLRLELASQPVLYTDYKVLRETPVVHVRPVTEASGVKVLFVPFRVTQVMENAELTGYSVGKMFWQTWAGMNVFEFMEYANNAGPFRLSTALALARSKGADMLVGGYVTHLLNGSNVAGSSLAVQLEAYDTSSGLLVWSMGHAAVLQPPQHNDYIVFSTKNKTPSDPIYVLATTMASDMGNIMYAWSKQDEIRAAEAEKARLAEEEKARAEQEGLLDKISRQIDEIF